MVDDGDMPFWMSLSAVAIGGAGGAVGRFLMSEIVSAWTTWPTFVATLVTNMTGCALIGFVHFWLEASASDGEPSMHRPLIVVGLLGAFTTFSTFSLETMHLLDAKRHVHAGLYVLGSVIIGLIAVRAGGLIAGRVWG